MDRDPPWPAWDSAELLVASDSARVARYRLHQSWYREHILGVGRGEPHGKRTALVGNTLDPAAARADRSESAGLKEWAKDFRERYLSIG